MNDSQPAHTGSNEVDEAADSVMRWMHDSGFEGDWMRRNLGLSSRSPHALHELPRHEQKVLERRVLKPSAEYRDIVEMEDHLQLRIQVPNPTNFERMKQQTNCRNIHDSDLPQDVLEVVTRRMHHASETKREEVMLSGS